MKRTWRWFGPLDKVSINDMLQAGVQGVVSSLHHIQSGDVWTIEEIEKRQHEIERKSDAGLTGLTWDVVESLPVSEDIKRQSGQWRTHIENYKQSLTNLSACGIKVVCYNFMPILDWTRTELYYELSNGAKCMRFNLIDFAVFDIHVLQRSGAANDYAEDVVAQAKTAFSEASQSSLDKITSNVVCGLPGAAEGYTIEQLKKQLALYDSITDTILRRHHIEFISEIINVAESKEIRLGCHPDDPPFPLLGLPRIMSTEEDYRYLVETVSSPANGITLCSGSLGVLAQNDLPGMMKRLGDKVHFVHLRNVERETSGEKISFHEAAHLEGATDMVALVKEILLEEQRRERNGRTDISIPFRPDHGQEILSDLNKGGQPGYPAIGRLKGLAELRGIIAALSKECIGAA